MKLLGIKKTGLRKRVGHRIRQRDLGDTFRAQSARLLVGLDRSRDDGECAALPRQWQAGQVDQAFLQLRREQVTVVGATRYKAKGYFQESPQDDLIVEQSVVYEVLFIPDPKREATFTAFARNMRQIALSLAEMFCQFSVLVVLEDGHGPARAEFVET